MNNGEDIYVVETLPNGNKIHYQVVDGTAYHKATPKGVINILEEARLSNRAIQLRFCFGDVETGRDWEEIHDTTGYIGRSTGSIKIPLLIKTPRSTGGGGLLDHCIVKIERRYGKKCVQVYTHPKYHKDPGYDEGKVQLPLRDDLNPTILQTAKDLGWVYTESEKVEIGVSRTFKKSDISIWSCVYDNNGPVWARAISVNGRYINHIYYYELLDALHGRNAIK